MLSAVRSRCGAWRRRARDEAAREEEGLFVKTRAASIRRVPSFRGLYIHVQKGGGWLGGRALSQPRYT